MDFSADLTFKGTLRFRWSYLWNASKIKIIVSVFFLKSISINVFMNSDSVCCRSNFISSISVGKGKWHSSSTIIKRLFLFKHGFSKSFIVICTNLFDKTVNIRPKDRTNFKSCQSRNILNARSWRKPLCVIKTFGEKAIFSQQKFTDFLSLLPTPPSFPWFVLKNFVVTHKSMIYGNSLPLVFRYITLCITNSNEISLTDIVLCLFNSFN